MCLPHGVHHRQHLQSQHILSEVVAMLGYDFDARLHRVSDSGVHVTKLKPERGLCVCVYVRERERERGRVWREQRSDNKRAIIMGF